MKLSKNTRKAGFTLVEIMIVVAIIGLLAAIAIPNFVKARTQAQANACINNLRQYDGAAQQWALETKAAPNAAVTENNLMPYVKLQSSGANAGHLPTCPAGGSYSYNTLDTNAVTCSLSTATPAHILP